MRESRGLGVVLSLIALAVGACGGTAPTQDSTPVPEVTLAITATPTFVPMPTATAVPTITPFPSATTMPVLTPTPTSTVTAVPPTETPLPSPTATMTPTLTPTVTPTSTPAPSPTPTFTPTSTATPSPSPTPIPIYESVLNPSFELGQELPEGWSWTNADSSATVSWDNQVAQTGSRSLRWDFNISPSQSFEGCEGDINQVDQSGIIRIDSQMLYEISLWTRSTTAGHFIASGTLKVTLYDGEQGEITSFFFGLAKSEEWGQSAILFGPEPAADLPWAEGTEFVAVSIGNDFGKIDLDVPDQCDGESLNLWVDDVNVELIQFQ